MTHPVAFAKAKSLGRSHWASSIALCLSYCVLVTLLFHQTAESIVAIWLRSQTFAHGFLIVPIVIWLIWRKRAVIAPLPVSPEPRILLLGLILTVGWSLGHVVDVLIVQQLAFVGILLTGVWSIVGTKVVRVVAFPLAFLFAGVPMGESLIMPLTNLTADTTEYLIRVSGVPVFREGNFLTLPTGRWSVVEACSGIRYLIASVTLGLVYAYLAYQRIWKRVLFVLASILIPIVANSIRAYGVVMLGHLTEMRYGTGEDHLYYGWVLFGVVMILLFWIGSFWEDPPASKVDKVPLDTVVATGWPLAPRFKSWGLALVIASLAPLLAISMSRGEYLSDVAPLQLPQVSSEWTPLATMEWGWQPRQTDSDRQLYVALERDGDTVGLFLYQYLSQQQGVELVDGSQPWRFGGGGWHVQARDRVTLDLENGLGDVRVHEAVLSSGRQRLLAWTWYRVDGRYTANPYLAKMLEARQQVLEGRRKGTRFFVVTPLEELPVGEPPERARALLGSFVSSYLTVIEDGLDSVGEQ